MIVRRGDTYLRVLGVMDTPRESTRNVIARLRELGIRRMFILSGDNQQVASAGAHDVGHDEAWGDLMPDDKVAAIRKLSTQEGVAMVGDGVNDVRRQLGVAVVLHEGSTLLVVLNSLRLLAYKAP